MAHGNGGGHPFRRILEELIDRPGERFSLSAAARLAEEFALVGRRAERPRRPSAGHARASYEGMAARPEAGADDFDPDTSVEGVRRELRISPIAPIEELRRIRKRFAARNHPDRLPHSRRPLAEQRMKIANAIIDAEIERRRART
ncbi:MAG: hypothetical protein BroJett030_01660 [Alphaproteobacteria bacterium]|nr:MAG: hypothetical protein BroJett030_01660 [Alphaproteobacteria bacterium]